MDQDPLPHNVIMMLIFHWTSPLSVRVATGRQDTVKEAQVYNESLKTDLYDIVLFKDSLLDQHYIRGRKECTLQSFPPVLLQKLGVKIWCGVQKDQWPCNTGRKVYTLACFIFQDLSILTLSFKVHSWTSITRKEGVYPTLFPASISPEIRG